jgi:hypothetical protein
VAFTLLLVPPVILLSVVQPPACADSPSCRDAALEAAAREDFERFHDLAWRAMQTGRRNDPALMLLLARAQSLSGRPGDALVMLRRLTEMKVVPDDVEGDDFRRVRALAGWPDVEAAIAALKASGAAETVAAPRPESAVSSTRVDTAAAGKGTPPKPDRPVRSAPAAEAAAAVAPPAPAATPGRRATAPRGGEDALRLPASPLEPIGLAYDSVSQRFVVGDRHANKLIVADEIFKRVNDLIGAGSGGFGTLTALEIDRHRGDLWVTSSGESGGASVHKLQLVSGRVLTEIVVPDDWRPAAFGDLAITAAGTVVLLDSTGSRLVTLAPSARQLSRPRALRVASPVSLAISNGSAFIAHEEGLTAVDLESGKASGVRAGKGVSLSGLRRVRWYRGSLVALQDVHDAVRLIRLRLGRANSVVTAIDPLDDDREADAGSALTIVGDAAYYLTRTDAGPVIRRVPLR